MKTNMPIVYDYLDYREFLQAVYAHNKVSETPFSFAKWAAKGNFKSRSFLRLVMLGKRNLSSDSLPRVLDVLGLNKTQGHYFSLLVQYNQATSYQSREFFFKKLIHIRGSKESKQIQNTYHYLANFQTPRVQLLLNRKNVAKDVISLAGLLRLSESKMQSILENLRDLNLAEEVNGQWQAKETLIDVNDDFGNLALQSFHKKSLEEALAAIELPPEKRIYKAAILSLDEESYESIKQEMHEFLGLLIQKYKNEKPKTEKVYQVNINLIPVSEDLIHSSEKPVNESKPPKDQEKTKELVL